VIARNGMLGADRARGVADTDGARSFAKQRLFITDSLGVSRRRFVAPRARLDKVASTSISQPLSES